MNFNITKVNDTIGLGDLIITDDDKYLIIVTEGASDVKLVSLVFNQEYNITFNNSSEIYNFIKDVLEEEIIEVIKENQLELNRRNV